MAQNISIRKNIYDSSKFKEVVDTNFSELFNSQDNFNIDDFFNQYNRLFTEIPLTGQSSHTELIRRSTEYLGPVGPDAKDQQISSLQDQIKDELEQLQEANQPDISTVREHPRFPNGSVIRRSENSAAGWPDVVVMDQGFKRALFFSGDPELYSSFLKLSGYTSDNPPPRVPDIIIDDIPTGEPLTEQNFNDEFKPSKGSFEAEEFRISLDPTDAALNFDKYDGDTEAYKIALEKDFKEKTDLIIALEEKIEDFTKQIQSITGG